MSDIEFARTRMGAKFYDVTMPRIADELARLSTTVAVVASELKQLNANRVTPAKATAPAAEPSDAAEAEIGGAAALATIARDHLQIETLEQRNADALDFHEVDVLAVRDALAAAFRAGTIAAGPRGSKR
jgi:hypothetical protein